MALRHAHNVCLRWARKRGRDLLQLAEPLQDPDSSHTDLEDALVDDFDLEIELALAIVATMLGPTPARVAPVQAGPYPLTVSLYTDPANAGYALPFAIAPQQPQCGVLTFDLTSVPGTGVVATPVHASLAPDSNVRNGVHGADEITVRGKWNLLVSVDGPQGHAEASVPVTATAPPAIPLWLGWIIGLIPLYGLLAFMLLQRSRKEKLA